MSRVDCGADEEVVDDGVLDGADDEDETGAELEALPEEAAEEAGVALSAKYLNPSSDVG